MFAKREDWQGLERSELLKYFNDCGHFPTHQQIDEVWDLVHRGKSFSFLFFLLVSPSFFISSLFSSLHLSYVSSLTFFQFSSVQWLSHVRLFGNPWTAAHQASLSITNSQSPPKPMSIALVMPSNHLILCGSLLLLLSIFPSIRVFSNESALCIRWPKYWSFSPASYLSINEVSQC